MGPIDAWNARYGLFTAFKVLPSFRVMPDNYMNSNEWFMLQWMVTRKAHLILLIKRTWAE